MEKLPAEKSVRRSKSADGIDVGLKGEARYNEDRGQQDGSTGEFTLAEKVRVLLNPI